MLEADLGASHRFAGNNAYARLNIHTLIIDFAARFMLT
jgi:hypothetical protein